MTNPIQHLFPHSQVPLRDEGRTSIPRPVRRRLASSATVASIALASNAAAQFVSPSVFPQFAPPVVIPWSPGADPLDIDSGDIDGDGDVDVVASGSNALYWLENLNGQGSFGPARLVDTFAFTPYAVVSDFDVDGDLDLVSFSPQDGIRWHENLDGQGSFGPGQAIGPGSTVGVTDVVAADLDADGDPDLIAAWEWQGLVLWFENDGQGGIGTVSRVATQLPTYGRPRSVAEADVDGDGDLDVLLGLNGSNYTAVWFENLDGLGSFGLWRLIWGPPGNKANVVSISSGDLDGDGDLDVLCATGSADLLTWHENLDGLGTFATAVGLGSGDDMMVADLDCDGDLDVLASADAYSGWGTPYSWHIGWYEKVNGANAYEGHFLEAGSSSVSFLVEAHAADLDGDGDLDVVASPVSPGPLVWYENWGCH